MKVTLETDQFKNALNKVLSVVDKRNTRPILAYTLITAKDDHIEFTATDLEVAARVSVDANVENSGSFCVNAKNLFDILRELPNSIVQFEYIKEHNFAQLVCQDSKFNLLVCPNEDFPSFVFNENGNRFGIKSSQLTNIINKTNHSISNDETRLYLNGVYLQEVDHKLRAVATDGHRLSLVETGIQESNPTLLNGIIIPRKGVFELKKLADTFPDSELKISVDDSFIYVNAENRYYLSIRLISRDYPKYQASIPNKTLYTLKAEKNVILDAVKRIKIMSNEKTNGVRVRLKENELELTANHPSLGTAVEKVQVDYHGKDMEIGFNAKFLIDTFSVLDDENISLEFNNELSPVLIKSSSNSDFLGIVMPLKL
ncbi:MAG: DNA polymerase III subunit beta [Halobacteriovoraceae bacterium]|nr:DNA polymerase III subunit beta [Halobacteriovoraceae bacterium]